MKKIKSLFKRDYEGTRQVYDELTDGAEWVVAGEGVATLKIDGTSCMIRDGKLYKRYDRKKDKCPPDGWEAAEEAPDEISGHWPGWLPVGDGPDDKWHREGFAGWLKGGCNSNGTFELVGTKIQGNPYKLEGHELWRHGAITIEAPRTFAELKTWFSENVIEGVVWHRGNGEMVKIKRKDFGFKWPE